MHRILSVYSSDIFHISDNFFEICFESEDVSEDTPQVTPQVTHAVKKMIAICSGEMDRAELQEKAGLSDRKSFTKNYLNSALAQGLI